MDNRVGILLRVTPEDKQAIEERMKTAGITNMNAYIETMALYHNMTHTVPLCRSSDGEYAEAVRG